MLGLELNNLIFVAVVICPDLQFLPKILNALRTFPILDRAS